MTDVLDQPVPRELLSQILPESYAPQLNIDELGEGRVLGCLRHVPPEELGIFEERLQIQNYKYTTLKMESGPDQDIVILYFVDPKDDAVREGILLEQRELGLMEPPLSINEHLRLATAYGVAEELQEQFKERVLLATRQLGEEADTYPMICKECGAKFNLEAGATNPTCPECNSKYIKKAERGSDQE